LVEHQQHDLSGDHCIFMQISHCEVDQYADLTGDHNCIHQGSDAIVHGGLIIGKISGAIWKHFGDKTKMTGISRLEMKRPLKPDIRFWVIISKPTPVPRSRLNEQLVTIRVCADDGGNTRLICCGEAKIILPPSVDA